MRRLLIPLVILATLGGLLWAFLYVNDIPLSELDLSDITVENVQNIKNIQFHSGAGLAAKRALEMWDRGDFERLHRNFTDDVQQVLPLEAFVSTKSSLLIGDVLKPQIEDVKEEGDTAIVQASIVNPDIKALTAEIFASSERAGRGKGSKGEAQPRSIERQKVLIELRKVDGSWKISQFDPITEALLKLDEEKKKRKKDVEASREAELYMPKVIVSNVRAQAIHMYGPEPFIVGLVKNTGRRDVQRLGIKFTVRDRVGSLLFEDVYHPVVESSISEEEKPLRPGEERKVSYQVDRAIPGWQDTSNVTYKVIELWVGPEYEDSAESEAKQKIRKARS